MDVPGALYCLSAESAVLTDRGLIGIQTLAKQLCPNLNDSLAPRVIGVLTVLMALALISVVLRVISRRVGRVTFWWDDYLIFIAMVLPPLTEAVFCC